jgi:hypothetical protein
MPKVGLMAQISRPFQIALAAIVLFALVWMVALRGHSTSTSPSSSPAPTPSSSASPTSSVYHGPAPGVEGLSRAVAKARGAATTSQQNAKQLQEKAAQASGEKVPTSPTGSTTAPKVSHPAAGASPAATATHAHAKSTPRSAPVPTRAHPNAATGAAKSAAPSMQVKVEAELKQGKVVTILFWNPAATDDRAVNGQLRSVGSKLRGSIAVHAALASQVASFGTIIRGVKVYGTPTLMIINQRKLASTLTGYTDAYSIEQAISEARHS